MEFSEVIAKRYAVRGFKPDPVEEEKLARVLEAARLAPTACNRQPFRFIVLHTAGCESEIRRMYDRAWFAQAPIVICACAIPSKAWVRRDGRNYADIDVTIAMDHLVLAATDLGLGTCWVAAFDIGAVREILHLPPEVEPIALTPLGYPSVAPGPKDRQELSALVRYDRW
jgi:nitroreductase